jgi:hypothetical protein
LVLCGEKKNLSEDTGLVWHFIEEAEEEEVEPELSWSTSLKDRVLPSCKQIGLMGFKLLMDSWKVFMDDLSFFILSLYVFFPED